MLQTQSLEEVTKVCSNGRLFLNCFKKKKKKRGGEGRGNDILIIHLSLPVCWARFPFLVCWNELRTTLLMAVELLLDLCLCG